MSNIINLNAIESEIARIEYNIQLTNTNLFKAESDITLLSHLQKCIEENIGILKKHDIIPLLLEFKKAKEDLIKVNQNLIVLKNNRETFNKDMDKLKNLLETKRIQLSIFLESNKSKVIQGNFGNKNGR